MSKEDANGGEGISNGNDAPDTVEELNQKADDLTLADSSGYLVCCILLFLFD